MRRHKLRAFEYFIVTQLVNNRIIIDNGPVSKHGYKITPRIVNFMRDSEREAYQLDREKEEKEKQEMEIGGKRLTSDGALIP